MVGRGVGLVMQPVVQALERLAAQLLRGVEPVGRVEMGQQRIVVQRAMLVRRRTLLRPFDLSVGDFLGLLHTEVLPQRSPAPIL